MSEKSPSPKASRAARVRGVVSFVLGLALLTAALVAVGAQRETLRDAWGAIMAAPPWLAGVAIVSPAVGWVCTSTSFWILTRRFGRVGLLEMHALIAIAWVLNYLPLRPGMLGRVAYHRTVNQIPVKASIRVLVESMALGWGALMVLLGAALCLRGQSWLIAGVVLAVPFLLAWGAAGAVARIRPGDAWRYPAAFALKYADMLVWTARYAAVFALIGEPIGLAPAALVTGVSQVVLLVPFTGNGVGLREWAIGLLAPAVGLGVSWDLAVSGDLLNRGIELGVSLVLGLIAGVWLAPRLRQARATADEPEQSP